MAYYCTSANFTSFITSVKREFQEPTSRTLLSVHKSKSYEERELEYNEARSRIFNTDSVSLANHLESFFLCVSVLSTKLSDLPSHIAVSANKIHLPITENPCASHLQASGLDKIMVFKKNHKNQIFTGHQHSSSM